MNGFSSHADAAELAACLHFANWSQVRGGSHPDLEIIRKPVDKSAIPVELLVGDAEHRGQEGFCRWLSRKSRSSRGRVGIIDDADDLNQEGANALLKVLEEPPPGVVLILIGTSEQRQLPTVRSRARIVRFQPLSNPTLQQLLLAQGIADSESEAAELAELAGGSLARAIEISDPALRQFRREWLEFLSRGAVDRSFAAALDGFVKLAGTEGPPKRARLRLLLGEAVEYYRQLMRAGVGGEPQGDGALREAVRQRLARGPVDPEAAAAALDRCVQADAEVASFAHQTAVIECLLDDLETLNRRGYLPVG